MILFEKHGNILESDLQTLVCPVNTFGAMGAGLALYFKLRHPNLYTEYLRACYLNVFKKKGFFVYTVSPERKILCLPTKMHWKNPSRLDWIDIALEKVALHYEEYGITSLAVPAIGCGLGQLNWEDVYPLIIRYLKPLELEVGIYLP